MTASALLLVAGLIAVGWLWYLHELRLRQTHPISGGLHREISLPFKAEFELYHNDFSLCSKKIRMCLAELEIPVEAHHIDLIETGRYETLSRAFLKINPAGLVPVLVHNGHPIFESHDILSYAARYARSEGNLIPSDADDAEIMQRWIDKSSLTGDDPTRAASASAGNCIPGLTLPLFAAMMQNIPAHRVLEGLLFHRLKVRPLGFLAFKFLGPTNLARIPRLRHMVEVSVQHMKRHLSDLTDQLERSGGPWILGETFSLADISWAVIFDRLREADWQDVLLDPIHLEYWQCLQARPSYRQAMDLHRHPTVTAGTRCLQIQKTRTDATARSGRLLALYR